MFKEAKITQFMGKEVRVLAHDKFDELSKLNNKFISKSNPFYLDFIIMRSLKVNCYKINYNMDLNEIFKDSEFEKSLEILQVMNEKDLQGNLCDIINHFGYDRDNKGNKCDARKYEFFSKLMDAIIEINIQRSIVTYEDEDTCEDNIIAEECAIDYNCDDNDVDNEDNESSDEHIINLSEGTHEFLKEIGIKS